MKYFEVEEGRIESPITIHAVASDGGWCSGGEVLDGTADILLWYRVSEYDENGITRNVIYYNVSDDGEHSNADEVLEQIKADHPANEWQDNDW